MCGLLHRSLGTDAFSHVLMVWDLQTASRQLMGVTGQRMSEQKEPAETRPQRLPAPPHGLKKEKNVSNKAFHSAIACSRLRLEQGDSHRGGTTFRKRKQSRHRKALGHSQGWGGKEPNRNETTFSCRGGGTTLYTIHGGLEVRSLPLRCAPAGGATPAGINMTDCLWLVMDRRCAFSCHLQVDVEPLASLPNVSHCAESACF